jgi:hypothetical protein
LGLLKEIKGVRHLFEGLDKFLINLAGRSDFYIEVFDAPLSGLCMAREEYVEAVALYGATAVENFYGLAAIILWHCNLSAEWILFGGSGKTIALTYNIAICSSALRKRPAAQGTRTICRYTHTNGPPSRETTFDGGLQECRLWNSSSLDISCSAGTITELHKGIIICDCVGVFWPDMQSNGKTAAMQTMANPMAAFTI